MNNMGDRYLLTVLCNCGFKEEDVWYAPTSGVIEWRCPICHKIINLEDHKNMMDFIPLSLAHIDLFVRL